jgi:hypothetical protein
MAAEVIYLDMVRKGRATESRVTARRAKAIEEALSAYYEGESTADVISLLLQALDEFETEPN